MPSRNQTPFPPTGIEHNVLYAAILLTLLFSATARANTKANLSPTPASNATNDLTVSSERGAFISLARWVVPRFIVDTTGPIFIGGIGKNESTLWAVRNEENVPITINVLYNDLHGDSITFETFQLDPRETITRNLISVTDLRPAILQDRAEGSIWFVARRDNDLAANDARILIDTFSIDFEENFANGGKASSLEVPCRFWSVRYLDFGSGPSSIDVLTEPRGNGPADPPTVMVQFYDEAGDLLHSLNVFSDDYTFSIPVDPLVVGSFGTAEITFGAGRSGVVSVRHSAFGKFSVGYEAYCFQ